MYYVAWETRISPCMIITLPVFRTIAQWQLYFTRWLSHPYAVEKHQGNATYFATIYAETEKLFALETLFWLKRNPNSVVLFSPNIFSTLFCSSFNLYFINWLNVNTSSYVLFIFYIFFFSVHIVLLSKPQIFLL